MTRYVTKPIADLGLTAIKTTMDFDKQMSKVMAVTGATGDEFQMLRGAAQEMGRTTSKTATESAQAIEYMGLAGWDTGQIMDGLEPILRASEAGAMDLGLTSDLVTDSMSALGIETKDLNRYLDIGAKAQNTSNQSMQQFLEGMVTAGGTFKMFNTPLEEAGALLGILANRGFKGSEAGNALTSIMANLTTGTGKAGKAIEELGLEVYDDNDKFVGMTNILEQLNGKFDGMTEKQRNTYIQMLGGKTRTKELNALLNGTSKELGDLTKGLYNADGSLSKMAKTMQDNLAGQVTRLKSAFEGILIQIGDRLTPYVEKAANFLQTLADKFMNLPSSAQQMIIIILGIVAAIGPLIGGLGILGGLVSGIATLFALVSSVLAAVSTPVILITVGIVALIAAVAAIIKHFFSFKEILGGLKTAFDAVKNVISALGTFLTSVFSPVIEVIKKSFSDMDFGPIIKSFDQMKVTIGPLVDFLKTLGAAIGIIVVSAIGILMGVINGLVAAFSNVMAIIINLVGVITSVFNIIIGIFTLNSDLITESALQLWENVKGIFINAVMAIVNLVKGFIDGVISFFKSLYNTLVGNSIIPDMINGIINWFKKLISKPVAFVKKLYAQTKAQFDAMKSAVTAIAKALVSAIINHFTNQYNRVKSILNSIKSFMSSVWSGIKSVVSSAASNIYSKVSSAFSKVLSAIKSKVNSAKSAVKSAMSGIVSIVSSIGSSLYSAGKNIIQSLINGIKSMAGGAKGAVKGIVSGIRNLLPFSPAKEGPLSDLDKTGPAFINEIIKGLKKRQPKLQAVAADLSSNLSNVTEISPSKSYEPHAPLPSMLVEIKGNNIWNNKAVDEIGNRIVKRIQTYGSRRE